MNLNDLKIEHIKEKEISLEFSLSFLFLERLFLFLKHLFLFLEIANEKNVHFLVFFNFQRIYLILSYFFV